MIPIKKKSINFERKKICLKVRELLSTTFNSVSRLVISALYVKTTKKAHYSNNVPYFHKYVCTHTQRKFSFFPTVER